jgi:hypothetical protein
MTFSAAVVTTFPNSSWDVYSKRMLQAFSQNWPKEIPVLIGLDDDLLLESVKKFTRPQDAICIGWGKEHGDFVERNKGKDDANNYRKQPVRFCHKVFTIARAYDSACKQKASGEVAPRYLIWMDADVITTRKVTLDDIQECLPKPGDVAATQKRKDWPHSECGWIAFDLENGAGEIIEEWFHCYTEDKILTMEQQDDSWAFDQITKDKSLTNLSADAPGLDVWQFTPMGKWSKHYKGPMAKSELMNMARPQMQPQGSPKVVIQTQNAIPHESICEHIKENQRLIKNWIKPCEKHDEEIVVVSAGPMLIAEDLRDEIAGGRKIVAVKHAVEPLRKAGITPWACILLDPRPHMNDFVKDPDPNILWFVASQVEPSVTMRLLSAGCTVWGYHASVGAGEQDLTAEQIYAVISGGSATATRGLFVLNHLGFHNFRLYGYNLCHPDKPDLAARDDLGQPKYMEISIGFDDKHISIKKHFWTEPQFIAQFEEMKSLIETNRFGIEAFGDGVIPFLVRSKKASDLRNRELTAKMLGGKTYNYKEMLGCQMSKTSWPKWLPNNRRKRKSASKSLPN